MTPITIHPVVLYVLAGVVLLVLGVLAGRFIKPRRVDGHLRSSPRLTFMPVRTNAIALASFMLTAFVVAQVVAIDFLREGLRLLANPATQAEGVNQIMLAVIAQNALYVLLSAFSSPLGELRKQTEGTAA